MEDRHVLRVRRHGSSGPSVVVLHGGPAAVGEAAAVAHGLADSFRVLEPWQRGSGEEPLTVAGHVADLHRVVLSSGEAARPAALGGDAGLAPAGEDARPALVGHSWGAMLALAYAAAHPSSAGPLVLVGCGTFDDASRKRMQEILRGRMNDDLRRRLERLDEDITDPAKRFAKRRELIEPLYSYDPVGRSPCTGETQEPFDLRAHEETWADMLRLQREGVYPAAFAKIKSPVLMLHGAYDPHPGRMIEASLRPYMPKLEYREFEQCGHSPWLESAVRAEFFAALKGWLAEHTA